MEEAFEPRHGGPGVLRVDGVVPLEHRRRLVAGDLHDHAAVHPGLAHVRVERVAQVMDSQILDPHLPAGPLKGEMNEPTLSLHHERPDTDAQRDQRQADADMQRAQRQGRLGQSPKRYWRADEVADYFAISERTVYRLFDDGVLQAIRIRSCLRVALEEVSRFEEMLMDAELF